MQKKLKYYIATIILLGISFVLLTLDRVDVLDYKGIIFFLILSVVAESLLIPTPNQRGISVGFAINLTAILILGIPQAQWITSLGVMLRLPSIDGKCRHIFNTPLYKTLFNGANIMLSSGLAGLCYEALGGIPGKLDLINILPMVASIAVYIIINNVIMSILMSILSGEKLLKLFCSSVIWVIRDNFALAPLGIIMAIAYLNYGIFGVLLFFGPLLLARYSFKMYIDMKNVYVDTVKALCQALEAKDPYTQGHSMRVCDLACKLGEIMGLNRKRMENLKIAAMLHDIGKIGIDEHILNKPDRLTDEEYNKIKQHPVIGAKIIQEVNFLKDAADIIISHHERFDGSGYPEGRKHSEISIESGILCIVDVFDALTSDRPYRKAMTVEGALNIIERDMGSFFNPKIAKEFVKIIKEEEGLRRIAC